MQLFSKHQIRDAQLPKSREALLQNIIIDLKKDKGILGVFLGGSLGKGNPDLYSDIDLRIIVESKEFQLYIKDKENRAKQWGNVLFYETQGNHIPYTVLTYDNFIKLDVFYYTLDRVTPSLWLQDIGIMYDPSNHIKNIQEQSKELIYELSQHEVEIWRNKIFAYAHEIYRRVIRDELYYASSLLEKISWFITSGWYMEAGHVPNSWFDWAKIEGERSKLKEWQLVLLHSWYSKQDKTELLKTLADMYPEILRLNKVLCETTGLDEKRDQFEEIMQMVL